MSRLRYDDYVDASSSGAGATASTPRPIAPPSSAELEDAVRRLPVLPALLHELMQELRDDNADIKRLEERIASDPSLTTRVLKMANSPFYVRASEVVDVSRAVMTLGFRTVSNLVMAAGLRSTMGSNTRVPGYVTNGIFLHSLATGLGCSRLPKVIPALRAVSDELFVAGLLHDIGRVALTEFYQRCEASFDNASATSLTPELERRVLGSDHHQVGKLVHAQWGLPDELLGALSRHHEPIDAIAEEPVVLAVSMVDCLLEAQGFARNTPVDGASERASEIALKLDSDLETVEALMVGIDEEVSSIAGSFS